MAQTPHPANPPSELNPSEKRLREAVDAARHPADFKLAKAGSKDYVAGQPANDAELAEVIAEEDKRIKAGRDPKQQGGSVHMKTVQQYGPEGREQV